MYTGIQYQQLLRLVVYIVYKVGICVASFSTCHDLKPVDCPGLLKTRDDESVTVYAPLNKDLEIRSWKKVTT